MTDIKIETEGLNEVIQKMAKFPDRLNNEMNRTMRKSLDVLHENVPPYIAQVVPPEVYRRTGTLGRSLGTNYGGGKQGKPTVYSVTGTGKEIVGEFGTNLSYAQHVVDPKRQAYMHKPGYKGRPGWWTMDTIKQKAEAKIKQVWEDMVKFILGL